MSEYKLSAREMFDRIIIMPLNVPTSQTVLASVRLNGQITDTM